MELYSTTYMCFKALNFDRFREKVDEKPDALNILHLA